MELFMYDFKQINDMNYRIELAKKKSPSDFFTFVAKILVKVFTSILVILIPLQLLTTAIGGCAISMTFGLLLVILTIIWWPFLMLLLGTSWLWLKAWYLRPILLFPGILIAFISHLYIMLIPEPQKDAKYSKLSISDEWPLSWYLMKPPKEYYSDNSSDANNTNNDDELK
jgi:hypothetical protein